MALIIGIGCAVDKITLSLMPEHVGDAVARLQTVEGFVKTLVELGFFMPLLDGGATHAIGADDDAVGEALFDGEIAEQCP